jgi:hypothetical protein
MVIMVTFRRCHSFLLLFLLLGMAAAFQSPLPAQAISGDLVGAALEAAGAPIPSASITLTNPETGLRAMRTANGRGEYRFTDLPSGEYQLAATAPGFAQTTVAGIAIRLNATATVNVTLRIATLATSIDVVEASPEIDTSSAQIRSSYGEKLADDLPIASIGLGVVNLSLLSAGVGSSGGIGVGSGPSVGGQRPRNNNFTVDGVDNNSKQSTGPTVAIPNDSVAEFSLLQNQFLAEFGHSSGGQFNTVVKSGTNEFRGTVYEYVENRKLNAVDQSFANQGTYSLPRYDQNHLGGNFGGPIRRDKLFFFGSLEYNPLGQASSSPGQLYAPTSTGYATLAAIPGVNQTNLAVMKQYATAPGVTPGAPAVTIGAASVPTGLIPVVAPNYTNNYFTVVSLDYAISATDQLRGRYIVNRSSQIDTGAELPVFYTAVATASALASLAEYHSFGASITNEFRFGYSRFNNTSPAGDKKFPGLDAFPNLVFNDLNLQLGPDSSFPQAVITNVYSGTDNVAWVRGNHTFKFGTEFRKYIAPEQFTQYLRGDYEYTTAAGYLLDQTPDYQAVRSLGQPKYYGDQIATYSYAQDTWRLLPRLTLNLGLRYEYTSVPEGMREQSLNAIASVPGLLTFAAPKASERGLAPRAGVAYSLDRDARTVVRAGFGVSYDVIFDNIGLLAVPPEFSTFVSLDPGGSNFLKNGGITQSQGLSSLSPADARAATSYYIPNQTLPYAINWNAGVQHVFGKDYTLDVRYLGTRGVHLLEQVQLNRDSPVTATQSIPTYLSAPSPAILASLPLTVGTLRATGNLIPLYGNAGFTSTVTSFESTGWSSYNGLSVQLNRRLSEGLQVLSAYTWSHNIDNSTAEVASTFLSPRRAQDSTNLSPEKAASALDRRQRVTFSILYEAPWFRKSSSWAMRNLVGNWEVAPIYTYESPEYYTVLSGLDSNLNNDSASDRTIVNPSGVAGSGSGVYGLDRNGNRIAPTAATALVNSVVAYVAVNPNARYIQAGPGAFATAGRNTQATRPIDNFDFSLIKRFAVPGRDHMRFDVAMQAFNFFNHAQFVPGSVDNAQLTPQANGRVLSYINASSPLFNNPSYAFNSNARVLQITAKLFF